MTFTETVPFTFPTDTAARLLLTANLVELHPERWNQEHYHRTPDGAEDEASEVAGTGIPKCGTTLCVAGWGVALTPDDEIDPNDEWDKAGCKAFGFDADLGGYIFYRVGDPDDGSAQAIRAVMPNVLRALADIPEEDRNLRDDRVAAALDPFRNIIY